MARFLLFLASLLTAFVVMCENPEKPWAGLVPIIVGIIVIAFITMMHSLDKQMNDRRR